MDKQTQKLIDRIEDLLARTPTLKATWWSSSMGECGFKDTRGVEELYTEAISLVKHVCGVRSTESQRVLHFYNQMDFKALERTEGLLSGIRANLENGLVGDLHSKVLVDIKTDFLAEATELLEQDQKDPASVLAAIVLEDSLKRLASKHGLDQAQGKEMGGVASALLKKGVIEKSTNQSIQSFKNLRNAALHAQWEDVSKESVGQLLVFLPIFIEKHGL